jgi:hypothetical protein
MINRHLDHFGAKSGHIRCDNGGELAGCDDFVTSMALRGYIVEPTFNHIKHTAPTPPTRNFSS